jgi:hypothetical protein
MAPGFYGRSSGGLGRDLDGSLARVHALRSHGESALVRERREAEVTQGATGVDLVHALPGERDSPAVAAAGDAWRKGPEASAHEHAGEVGHGKRIRGRSGDSFVHYEMSKRRFALWP